jgi:nucleotide-binding universal stress UspA family protein
MVTVMMITPRRILFPTDFSANAEGAFDLAAHVAARFGASLRVLHVQDPSETRVAVLPEDRPALRPPLIEHFDVRSSSPAKAIVKFAETDESDLIVMATRARRGFDHIMAGSVTRAVIHEAPCPVLVMKTGFTSRLDLFSGPILLPLDFAENNLVAAAIAREAASILETDLHAIHVVESPLLGTGLGMEVLTLYRMAQTERIESVIKSFVVAAGGPPVNVVAHVEPGAPGTHICAVARQLESSLIVMPLNSKTGLQRLFVGSTTEQVIREASCPVLTFGAASHERLERQIFNEMHFSSFRPETLTYTSRSTS